MIDHCERQQIKSTMCEQQNHEEKQDTMDLRRKLSDLTRHIVIQKEQSSRRRKKQHARLLAQVPASSVSRSPGGNNRQERKDAVSGREGNIEKTTAWANKSTSRKKQYSFPKRAEVKGTSASGV